MLTQDTAYRLLQAGFWQGPQHTEVSPYGFAVRLGTEVFRESDMLPMGVQSHIGDAAIMSSTYQRHTVPAGCILPPQALMVVDTKVRVMDTFEDYVPIFTIAPYLTLNGMEYFGSMCVVTDPMAGSVLLPFRNLSKRTALSMNPGMLLGYFSAIRAT